MPSQEYVSDGGASTPSRFDPQQLERLVAANRANETVSDGDRGEAAARRREDAGDIPAPTSECSVGANAARGENRPTLTDENDPLGGVMSPMYSEPQHSSVPSSRTPQTPPSPALNVQCAGRAGNRLRRGIDECSIGGAGIRSASAARAGIDIETRAGANAASSQQDEGCERDRLHAPSLMLPAGRVVA